MMSIKRQSIYLFSCFILFVLFMLACGKNGGGQLDGNIQIGEIIAPVNGLSIVRAENDNAPVDFSWKKAEITNGSMLFYTVVFDVANGDFSKPILEKSPSKGAITPAIQLSRIDLESLFKRAEGVSGEAKDFKWKVIASNGVVASSSEPFRFSLKMEAASEQTILKNAADQLMGSLTKNFLDGMPLDIWAERYPKRDTYWDGASTVWGQGGIFSGYTALRVTAKNDPTLSSKYQNQYAERLLKSIDRFRNTRQGGPEAYAVFPGDGDERYYDDNIWIGLDMVDLYNLTKDSRYLDRAKLVWKFILAGTSDLMGGGVHWKEGDLGKNTCSTAPAAVLAAKLYKATGEQAYLDAAKAHYTWLKNRLQDPADYLFWDNVKLSDNSNPNSAIITDKVKYTYNSGQPIEAAVLLYNITGESSYLLDAQNIAKAAFARWFKPYHSSALNTEIMMWNDHNLWFNAILVRGYIALYHADDNSEYVDAFKKILLHAWMSPDVRHQTFNFLKTNFTGVDTQSSWEILHQGACVEMLARLADL